MYDSLDAPTQTVMDTPTQPETGVLMMEQTALLTNRPNGRHR